MSILRTIELSDEFEIEVFQHPQSELETSEGTAVWDAALVLIHYITKNKQDWPDGFFQKKRILELGSGTGAVGIALATLGVQRIVLTDLEEMVPFLSKNLEHNKKKINSSTKVEVIPFKWGDTIEPLGPPFDYIICSDVAYNSESFRALVSSFVSLCAPNTEIYLSHELRNRSELNFFQLLKNNDFEYSKVDNSRLDSVFQSDDIGIFKIKKVLN